MIVNVRLAYDVIRYSLHRWFTFTLLLLDGREPLIIKCYVHPLHWYSWNKERIVAIPTRVQQCQFLQTACNFRKRKKNPRRRKRNTPPHKAQPVPVKEKRHRTDGHIPTSTHRPRGKYAASHPPVPAAKPEAAKPEPPIWCPGLSATPPDRSHPNLTGHARRRFTASSQTIPRRQFTEVTHNPTQNSYSRVSVIWIQADIKPSLPAVRHCEIRDLGTPFVGFVCSLRLWTQWKLKSVISFPDIGITKRTESIYINKESSPAKGRINQ